ncbi:MAG: hypothetical protein Q4A11_05535 [Brachymonas sp.]|nr:hypothetical protein [Brachymonas sp.]
MVAQTGLCIRKGACLECGLGRQALAESPQSLSVLFGVYASNVHASNFQPVVMVHYGLMQKAAARPEGAQYHAPIVQADSVLLR